MKVRIVRQAIASHLNIVLFLLTLLIVAPVNAAAQQTSIRQEPGILTRPTPSPSWPPPSALPTTTTTTAPDVAQPDDESPTYGRQGVLVETLDGAVVMEQSVDQTFNPASAVKLATALAALRTFGAQHRFTTVVWTNGTLDKQTGTITGDLIVSGRDPSFHYEHAVVIARELNRQGIRVVSGDLIVAPGFTMNFDWSAFRSGGAFYDTLDSTRRPAAATQAWEAWRRALGDTASLQSAPSVAVMGAVYVESVPPRARMLLTHRSSKLIDVLKVLLCYSNNFMAERVGDTLGGPQSVRRHVINFVGVQPSEFFLSSASGLGVNRATPHVMMKIYRALLGELAKNRLTASDILPVAGIDPGTLQERYTDELSRGSVIAKTGTLIRTDGGVSALVGQMRARSGETLLFVILNQRGSVLRFRSIQDMLVTELQNSRGGPAPFNYRPHALAMRLADTELDAAATHARQDEYEPGAN